MEGCGKRIDLYHNEYAFCGKDYFGKVFLCDACKEPRNLPKANVKPSLCDVLAEIKAEEISADGEFDYLQYEDVSRVLSKYFA